MAGLRWGFSGVSANIVSLVGLNNLWVVIALLPSLSVLFGSLLIFDCLRSNKLKAAYAGVCTVGGLVNVNFLHGWHEGGLAQAWAFISLAVLLVCLIDVHLSTMQRISLMSFATLIAISGYYDWFIVVVALLLIMFFIGLKTKQFSFVANRLTPVFGALLLGAMACGPFFIRFCFYITRRLNDAGVGGWPLPVWTGIGENLGIFNPYNLAFPYQGHPGIDEFFVVIANAASIAILMRIMIKRCDRTAMALIGSVAVFFTLIMFKTRILDGSSNYQYFKAVGLLAPILLPLFGFAINSKKVFKLEKQFISLLSVCAVIACCSYIINYRHTSIRLPHMLPSEVLESNRHGELDRIDIISEPSFNLYNLSPFTELRMINRGVKNSRIRVNDPQQIGILIDIKHCYKWLCVKNVDKDHLLTITKQHRLLLLDEKSDVLLSANGRLDPSFIAAINIMSMEVHGPWFSSDLTPMNRS